MNRRTTLLAVTLSTLAATSGCVSDTRVGEDDGMRATLEAGSDRAIPDSGEILVVWVVSAGSPDYSYAFGRESFADTTTVALPLGTPPPAEALNHGLGVGFILAFSGESGIPDGRLDDTTETALESSIFGAASNQAIIYRADTSSGTGVWWADDFAPGFACGEGVPNPAGSGFDGFSPIDCGDVTIQFVPFELITFPNWT